MKKIITLVSRLKWIGLIGVVGTVLDNRYLEFFWLFFLLAFAEIAYYWPMYSFSLQQVVAFPVILVRRLKSPRKACQASRNSYSLPLRGSWVVVNGGSTKLTSHSWGILSQRYAYDFVKLDEDGRTWKNDPKSLESYYAYNELVCSPADGIVWRVVNGVDESKVEGNGTVDSDIRSVRGNYIVLRHANNEYSMLAHLKKGSARVRKGESVRRGQVLGSCGNSGNSSEPHVHFQVNQGGSDVFGPSIPVVFRDISVSKAKNYDKYDVRKVDDAEWASTGVIFRGLMVANISEA